MPRIFFPITFPTKSSLGHMIFTSIIGILVGLLMLLYPGGTMTLMKAGFRVFQGILSFFILYYTFSQAVYFFKEASMAQGVAFILFGILLTALIWILDVRWVYFAIAFFLWVMGISELVGSFLVPFGKFFLALLGIIDIGVGVIIILYPVFLALLIAWYILFWGISRLALYLEIRKFLKEFPQ